MFQSIDHVHVFVTDREAAAAWYARVLDLHPVPALAGWAADGGPLTLANAEDSVHLALFERPLAPCRSTIALRVDGAALLAWRERVQAATGLRLELVDHGASWSFYFDDPDGNPYEVTSYEVAPLRAQAAGGS
jgi:catechol 2,3-dioxygenase-like lactoylglutathione lyase family enzyme